MILVASILSLVSVWFELRLARTRLACSPLASFVTTATAKLFYRWLFIGVIAVGLSSCECGEGYKKTGLICGECSEGYEDRGNQHVIDCQKVETNPTGPSWGSSDSSDSSDSSSSETREKPETCVKADFRLADCSEDRIGTFEYKITNNCSYYVSPINIWAGRSVGYPAASFGLDSGATKSGTFARNTCAVSIDVEFY